MFRFIWLSFLGQPRKHLSVALIFGIDLAQPHNDLYTPLVDEFTLQIHEIWPSLNPYGPSKCSGGVFERSIWNSKCSGGAFRILNAPLNASPRPVARSIGLGRLVNWTRPPGR